MKYHHVLLGIGSGVCSRCRKELVQRMADKENRVEPNPSSSMNSNCNVEASESTNAEFIMEETKEEASLLYNCFKNNSIIYTFCSPVIIKPKRLLYVYIPHGTHIMSCKTDDNHIIW
ncbi:Hypothetical predicted protein [Mytilus galloprovincialis]|uniref:Uncharacterized protein n=1 Tax=Mytilus galloprovincialis TaxID=29158 RepID=A0A8B6FYJ0_MYTGA|nr:Hypothetical predicted protein [Mytilus galloprovincialis]